MQLMFLLTLHYNIPPTACTPVFPAGRRECHLYMMRTVKNEDGFLFSLLTLDTVLEILLRDEVSELE